jgi:hypothetical protein
MNMLPEFVKIRKESVRQIKSIKGMIESPLFPALSSDVQTYLRERLVFLQQK